MDINDFRGIITAILLISFIGLWVWAWSSRRKAEFDKAATLPLEEDHDMSNSEREGLK
ncbi:MAG TPA: cbb3-type cytochrome c oxidase subunit 3 [Woeseiaceae bacterium]|jgi:cytochrome c oxidase cbb3-type subunit 4|nr:cbb3-type cytochrome c oxidase subunit 3 [Woeseiaceae bacterium]